MDKELFNISESLREDTSMMFLNQLPMHNGDSFCEEEQDDVEGDCNNLPGEPFINKLQRTFKIYKSIPIELLSNLIEILINDTLNLKNIKYERKSVVSSDSESENYKLSNNHSINSFTKQPTFPISLPIAREELKMRRNNNLSTYQKIDTGMQNVETFVINPINVKMQLEQNDQLIVKLYHEISEENNKRSMLLQLIRLSPAKIKISTQASQLSAAINKNKHKFYSLIKDLGKIKIFSQLSAFNNKKERSIKKLFEIKGC